MGDRSLPPYDELRPGYYFDLKSDLRVFSEHKGSDITIKVDGTYVAKYDGSTSLSIVIPGGDLTISGKASSDLNFYIVSGSTIQFMRYFKKEEAVYYSLDLPKEFATERQGK